MIPEELKNRLEASYGTLFSDILQGYGAKRAVTLRANTLKTTAEQVAAVLTGNEIAFERPAWYPDAFILPSADEEDVRHLLLYADGGLYLQSLSSMLPPLVLDPQAGENVLDMTAAPGGKTTELLALSGGKALITACERDGARFARMQFNLSRQGASRVNAVRTDALMLDDFLRFDKILLDAPCTGTGTITEGARIRFSADYLAKCVRAQKKLTGKAIRLLKKGGTLVYSTCSLLKEENEGAIDEALRLGAKLLTADIPSEIPRLPSREGTATILPTQVYEGFFVAKLTK